MRNISGSLRTSALLGSVATILFAVSGHAADMETVAVIGTGDMGDSLGPRFAELGYRVVYGSRDPQSDKVQALVRQTGNGASAAAPAEAASEADSSSWPCRGHRWSRSRRISAT
jgi:lactate dehydrogenase-like 2-hydroxyacid dehydrogenase